jgi:hypothetical protein
MTRRSVILLAAIVLLLAVVVALSERGRAPQSQGGDLLLPALSSSLDSVTQIEIVGGGNAPILVLARQADRWVATNKGDYPADVGKIRAALTALAEARILEQKTATPEYYDRLGVEPVETSGAGSTLLTIDAGPGTRMAVLLGNEEGQSYRYARLADQAQSYLIDRNPGLPSTAADWLDTLLLDLDGARIREVTVEHADGHTVRVFKVSPADANFALDGMPSGRELLYTGVTDTMAGALRALRFEDVRGAAPDAAPVATTTYRSFDGLVVRAHSYSAAGDDGAWIAFEASVDPEAAASPPAATAPEAASSEAPEASAASTPRDPSAEAAQLTERLGTWQYRLPSHKTEQLTRRTEDLLKALP